MTERNASPLRLYRAELGVSLAFVASAIGVTTSYLSKVETGKRAPSVRVMEAIAAWSGNRVTPNMLMGIDPYQTASADSGVEQR